MVADDLAEPRARPTRWAEHAPPPWRATLLQTALSVTAIAAIVFTAATAWMFTGATATINLGFGSAISAVLGITTLVRRWPFAVRAAILVASMFAVATVSIALTGYDPGPILIALWCVAITGLLFRRRALYFVSALLVATILIVGALQPYYETMSAAEDFAPHRVIVWVRVALVYAIMVTLMSVTLRSAVAYLERTLHDYTRASHQIAEALIEEESARLERTATELALQDSQKFEAVGHLSAGLAHELNNALTVIQLAAEKLHSETPGTAAAAAATADMASAWQRAADVTRGLLDLSRREPASIERVDACQVVRDSESALRNVLPEDVTLHIDARGEAPVLADVTRLRQALINLIVHARNSASPGGDVYLRLHVERGVAPRGAPGDTLPPGDYATFVVDVPDRDAVDAEDPPVTAEQSADELGMFTTLGIVRNAGGTMSVANGRGSAALRVFWPLVPPQEPALEPRAPAGGEPLASTDCPEPRTDAADDGDAADFLSAWRDATLTRVARTLAPIYAVIVVVSLPTSLAPVAPVLAVCAALLIVPLVWRSMPQRWRMASVIGGMVAVAGTIPVSGGFPPVAFALSATGIALAAALWGPRALIASAIVPVASIVAAGMLVGAGVVEPMSSVFDQSTSAFDPSLFVVWARIAVLMSVVLVVLGAMVVRTVDGLESASVDRHSALVALERQRELALAGQAAQVETARALAAADRADTVGRLAGSVAHDVNNALTVIGVWLQVLERPHASAAAIREGLDAIDEALAQAVSITRQLAFDSAQLPLRAHRCDLRDTVMRTSRTIGQVFPASIPIEVDAEVDAEVLVDPAAVRQILFNLALNARDAMPDGGVLHLRATSENDGRRAVLEVRDSGVGMTAGVAARAFEPFFTTKPAGQGTGLGLSSVKRIVKATGGNLSVRTEPGVGTRIRITWPLLSRVDGLRETTPTAGTADIAGTSVLLAEDEELVRNGMANALRSAGCRVMTACDGDEAAQLLDERGNEIDLLCADGIMPGTPTAELIAYCQERYPTIAILICSGHLPAELARRALPDSAVDFLLKPFSTAQLLAKVSEVLAEAERARQAG